ncbi:MAG: hypothetical protein K2X47_02340 [Bdellovibrionales bacterium]|nr:hypothetical protein [Bdellovibrionales bacterium]
MNKSLFLALLVMVCSGSAAATSEIKCAALAVEEPLSVLEAVIGSDQDVVRFLSIVARKYGNYGMFLGRDGASSFQTTEIDEKFEIGVSLEVINEKPVNIGLPMALGEFDLALRLKNRYGRESGAIQLSRSKSSAEIYQGKINLPQIYSAPIIVRAVPYKEMVLGGMGGYAHDGKPVYRHSIHRGFRLIFKVPRRQ